MKVIVRRFILLLLRFLFFITGSFALSTTSSAMEVPMRRLNVELIVPGGEVAVQQAVAGDDPFKGGLLVVCERK